MNKLMELNRMNGRTKWADYEGLETSQLKEHDVLINDLGHTSGMLIFQVVTKQYGV